MLLAKVMQAFDNKDDRKHKCKHPNKHGNYGTLDQAVYYSNACLLDSYGVNIYG